MRKTGVPGWSLAQLTEQGRKIEELWLKVRLEGEMKRQQVGMADWKIVELVRFGKRMGLEVALKSVMRALERTMKVADCVGLKTLKGILDVLSPPRSVDFLAGTSMLQIQLRQWGKRRKPKE